MSADKQQRLVLSIIDFLNESIRAGAVKQDDREGLEVAIQCIGEAFGVDPNDSEQCDRLSVKPATLQSIFDVFLKTRDKIGSTPSSTTAATSSSGAKTVTASEKKEAETLKQQGNTLMSSKKYDEAIEAYTKAIAIDDQNPVYYSNRAAAHSSKGDHLSAVGDAEKAIQADKSFVKAYHRLGHAQYCIGDYSASVSAFKRGLDIDPTNASLKTGLQTAEQRVTEDEAEESSVRSPGVSGADAGAGAGGMGGLADMLRGMGGAGTGAGSGGAGGAGGAGGGMPDLASIMNNPMLMNMASQMMANGGLDNLMRNPAVANMMERVQSGGGMPSMDEIMQNPELRNLAGQFGAGRGAGAGAGGNAA